MDSGAQFVTVPGHLLMQRWSADKLDNTVQVITVFDSVWNMRKYL